VCTRKKQILLTIGYRGCNRFFCYEKSLKNHYKKRHVSTLAESSSSSELDKSEENQELGAKENKVKVPEFET